ncbi:MAG: EscU/YscU/HrcU family type III secretion system export apparatus switch protein [Betaproteobacteria bacterium]|nr:EscU/YscU/HrcU family type III secretion system export apparatus switch protein [Betaproteobacteria bacterium]
MADPRPAPRAAAVALAYGEGDPAPRVVASGEGWLAEAIIAAARKAGVPVHEAPGLAPALLGIEPGRAIPPALYVAVAEVLAHLARLDRLKLHLPAPRGAR